MEQTPKRPKAVLLLSGGMDSATLLYVLKASQYDILALSIFYGQKHSRELSAAFALALAAKVPRKVIYLAPNTLGTSALTDTSRAIPEGHYEDLSMKQTVVPNRNMVFLAIATSHAIAIGANTVAYAAHAGDHTIYPDCRPEFVHAMRVAIRVGNWAPYPNLFAPFLFLTKADIVATGLRLKVPYELTWSCYSPQGDRACGKCGTCTERLEAFAANGVKDPVLYTQEEKGLLGK